MLYANYAGLNVRMLLCDIVTSKCSIYPILLQLNGGSSLLLKEVLCNSLVIPFSCVKMTGIEDLNSYKMEAYYSHTKLSHSVVATGNPVGRTSSV